MSKDFDEFWENEKLDGWVDKDWMLISFESGQQSKQAEIDELRNRINEISIIIEKANRLKSSNYLLGEIGRILKGKTNED